MRTIGPYRVVRELGRGNMGAVFAVQRADDPQQLALKVLAPELLGDADSQARLAVEIRAQARLEHPHVVRIVDLGLIREGHPYIVMELVEGETLEQHLARGLARADALELLAEVADALDYVHANGVLHRDVKPANILVDAQGRAKLTDFGISRIVNTSERLTQTGEIVGTPSYMAPELIDPTVGEQGPPTDVYALGVILYEVLAEQKPFVASSLLGVLDKILTAKLEPPSKHATQPIPKPLEAACLAALARDPSARTQRAGELAEALRAAPSLQRRRRWPFVGAAAAALGGLALWGASGTSPSPAPEPAATVEPSPAPAAPTAPAPAADWLDLAWKGRLREALAVAGEAPAGVRARLAAWSGARAEARAALEQVGPGRDRLVVSELWPLLGGKTPPLNRVPRGLRGPLAALCAGDTTIARAYLGALARDPRQSPADRLEVLLLLARACLGEADLVAAAEAIERALVLAEGGWQRLRVLVAAEPVVRAGEALAAARAASLRLRETLAREAPWLLTHARPEGAVAAWLRTSGAESAARARAWADLGFVPERCVGDRLEVERYVQAIGPGGAAGFLVTRACTRAAAAERGNDLHAVPGAEELIAAAAALAPRSLNLALARSRLLRLQRRPARAVVDALVRRAPGSPTASLEQGRVRVALAEGAPTASGEGETRYAAARARLAQGLRAAVTRRRYAAVEQAYAQAVAVLRRALEEARSDPELANEARLALGRALRGQLVARHGAGRPLGQLPTALEETLRPLLHGLRVDGLGVARRGLVQTLLIGDERVRRQAEDRLLKQLGVGPGEPVRFRNHTLRALRLLGAGAPRRQRYVEAYRLLAGDLPAFGLLGYRLAEAAERRKQPRLREGLVQRAARIGGPRVGPARLAMRLGDPRDLLNRPNSLGELVRRYPELLPHLIRLNQLSPEAVKAWRRTLPKQTNPYLVAMTGLGVSAVLRGQRSSDPRVLEAASRGGASLARDALLAWPTSAAAHLLRALHLTGLGLPADGDVTWGVAQHLRDAEAARPWSPLVSLARLWVDAAEPRHWQRYLGIGSVDHARAAAPWFIAGKRRERLAAQLRPYETAFPSGSSPQRVMRTVLPHADLLCLQLVRYHRAQHTGVARWLRTVEALGPAIRSLRFELELRSPRAPVRALDAIWAAAPGGRLGRLPDPALDWTNALPRLGVRTTPLIDHHRQAWFGQHQAIKPRQLLVQALSEEPFPPELADPWGLEELCGRALADPRTQCDMARAYLPRGSLLEPSSMALRALMVPSSGLALLVEIGKRAQNDRRLLNRPLQARRLAFRLLDSLAHLLERASIAPGEELTIAALRLDFALFQAESGASEDDRKRLLAFAQRLAEAIPLDRSIPFETPLSLCWRRLRVAAIRGDEPAVERALEQLGGLPGGRDLSSAIQADPLGSALRRSAAIRARLKE